MTKKEKDIQISPAYSGGFSTAGVAYNDKNLQDPNVENSGIKNEHNRSHSASKEHFYVHFGLKRKYYESKIFIGSFLSFIILLLIIIIPVSGFINVPYPLAVNQNINNNGNQILTENNPVVYKTEYLWKDNSIEFSGTSNKPVSYVIWNNSLNNINPSNKSSENVFSNYFNVENGNYSVTSFFLFKGDSLNLGITYPGSPSQYGIPSGSYTNLEITNQLINNETIKDINGLVYVNGIMPNTTFGFQAGYNFVSFIAPETGTWHLIWLNPTFDFTSLQYQVTYHFNFSQFNLDQSNFHIFNQTTVNKQVYTIPQTGFYTLAIISQQINSNESIPVDYNMVFHAKQDAIDGWKSIDPILDILAILIFLIMVTSIIFRLDYTRNEKELRPNTNKSMNEESMNQNTESLVQQQDLQNGNFKLCPRCHQEIKKSDLFCSNCGVRAN